MMVITPKHVGTVLMEIVKCLLKQFPCASVGDKTLVVIISRNEELYCLGQSNYYQHPPLPRIFSFTNIVLSHIFKHYLLPVCAFSSVVRQMPG
jgi:uncharacterized Zn-finger protein